MSGGGCPVRSSVTDAPCELPEGHAAHSPTRFHKFSAPRRRFHVGTTKQYLVSLLADTSMPVDAVLVGWTGSRQEAIEAIKKDPRDVFVACDCPKRPNGACAGLSDEEERRTS